jgi:hypothetical protein
LCHDREQVPGVSGAGHFPRLSLGVIPGVISDKRRLPFVTAIGLVAAARMQRGGVYPAAQQFDRSPLFRRARDYCERTFEEWYVLCPGRPLLAPRQVIGAAPASLDDLAAEARQAWAETIGRALRAMAAQRSGEAYFATLASQRTVELLARAAPDLRFAAPLGGLTLGQRLRWYDERLRVRQRLLIARSA